MSYGTIKMRIGPMFSGKSTWLVETAVQLQVLIQKKCQILLITHIIEGERSNNKTEGYHNSAFKDVPKQIKVMQVAKLSDIDISQYQIIGIDEAQFFPDLMVVTNWVQQGKHIFVAGLDGDYKKNKFGNVLDLIPHADEIIKINALCKQCIDENEGYKGPLDNFKAPFTRRRINATEQVISGGCDTYEATCRYHHS